MKKKIVLLLLSTMLVLSSCGNNTNQSSAPEQQNIGSSTSEQKDSSSEHSEAEQEELNIELNIPADFIGDQTQEDLDAVAKEYGFKSITLNEDGSATYIMTKKQHEELLTDYRQEINDSLQELIGSESYPNFTKIESNDNFTEFTITTKSTSLDMSESFSVMAFYMYGGLYNVFSGEEVDNVSVTFVNEDTGEVISTSNSKDMQ